MGLPFQVKEDPAMMPESAYFKPASSPAGRLIAARDGLFTIDFGRAAGVEFAAPPAAQPNFPRQGGAMNKVLSTATVIASLVLTLGGAASWGQVPSTNDKSGSLGNTGGGTGALASPMLSG